MEHVFDAIGVSLPMALGIAASPSPVIAMLILLMTRKARSNALFFLTGWFSGLLMVGLLTLFGVGFLGGFSDGSSHSGILRMILGMLFLVLAVPIARQIPRKGQQPAPPGWLDKLDQFGFPQSFAFGFFFSVPNLKNASLVVTGMTGVLPYQLDPAVAIFVLFLFSLIASAGVLVPPVLYLLIGERATTVFGGMKIWLIRNRALILFLILLVFGVLWLLQGLALRRL
jgi:threonine/homoserine/homoserine lactone efflux protein